VNTTRSALLDRFALPSGFDTLLVDDASLFPQAEILCGLILGSRAICIGTHGLAAATDDVREDARASLDGRFAAIFDDGDHWIARTDFANQEQLFLYNADDGWILGSSLLQVATTAADRGMRLTRNLRHARSLRTGAFWQMPSGLMTPFNEILRLPVGAVIRINKKHRTLQVNLATVEQSLDRYAGMSFNEVANVFVSSTVSALASMQTGRGLVCDLTSGYDSRLVFALAMRASSLTGSELRTFSNRSRSEDWETAHSITREFGLPEPNGSFKFPNGARRTALDARTALSVWLHSAFDGKVGLEIPAQAVAPNGEFVFQATGHNAISGRIDTSHAAYADWVTGTELTTGAHGLMEDHRHMLALLGVEPESPLAMPFVTLQCYAPNHSGSHWKWSLTGTTRVTPLTHSSYVALYIAAYRTGIDLRAVHAGLLAAVEPRLLRWPHPKASRAWNPHDHLGAPIHLVSDHRLVPQQVFGSTSSISHPPASRGQSPYELIDELLQHEPQLQSLVPSWQRFRESTSPVGHAGVTADQNQALQRAGDLGRAARAVFLDALLRRSAGD